MRGVPVTSPVHAMVEDRPGEPGVRPLRRLLDRDTFVLSREELERLFLTRTAARL